MLNDKIIFWWDENSDLFIPIGGKIRHSSDGGVLGYGAREISGWLSNDIQYGIHSIDIWVRNLTDFASGKITDGNFGKGNAHWVMVTHDKVFIGCEHVEEQQVLLTIEQTLYVLGQYRLFLEGSYTKDFPPEPIDVEYLAEGRDAITRYESLEGAYCLPY
ncbi:hypothetical protein ROM51_16855 [Cronobacter sakazakii]|uniref:hypothetical protein n=2 Tax=Cronobacter sakazakii TaxID=28141 RepID=UPI002895722E|nr:hypothetical protein [Cronobacter sakazakii]MDT3640245.1 hypothetical protein [Cronobacter sakazakii]